MPLDEAGCIGRVRFHWGTVLCLRLRVLPHRDREDEGPVACEDGGRGSHVHWACPFYEHLPHDFVEVFQRAELGDHSAHTGMLETGGKRPLSSRQSTSTKSMTSMAYCWVSTTVEIQSPMPRATIFSSRSCSATNTA